MSNKIPDQTDPGSASPARAVPPGGLTRLSPPEGDRGMPERTEPEGGVAKFSPTRKHDESIDDLLSGRIKRHAVASGDGGG